MLNQALIDLLWEGTLDTIYMTLVSTFFSYVFGMIMAVILVITRADGIRPHPVIFRVLDVIVNLTRSFPFLILMIAIIPAGSWEPPSAITPRSFPWSWLRLLLWPV